MAQSFGRVLLLALGASAASNDDIYGTGDDIVIDPGNYECAKFKDIFSSGEEMCNTVWGSSFYYEPNDDLGYTWWFFDQANNPNDAATLARGLDVPKTCNVSYFHKSEPSAEGDDFTECHPWKESACCHEATVTTAEAMNLAYGPGYRWDRCGKLSDACERFFVAEACFYECDVNAGHFRTFSDAQVKNCNDDFCAGNTWSVTGIPVKASYCNSFFSACYNDYFHSSGNYWTAYEVYEEAYKNASARAAKGMRTTVTTTKKEKEIPGSVVVLIVVGACALCAISVLFAVLVMREKEGKPVFTPLVNAAVMPKSDAEI